MGIHARHDIPSHRLWRRLAENRSDESFWQHNHTDLAGAPEPLVSVAVHDPFDSTQLEQSRQPHHRDQPHGNCVRLHRLGPATLLSRRIVALELHSFNGSFNGTNGAYPCSYGYPSSFLLGSDGNFYGTTKYGGANDRGTIFRVSVPGADSPKILATSRSSSTITLTWLALRSRSYHLQFTTNLTQPNWTNSGSPITATNTTAAASDIVGPDRQRFYRVALLP